MTKLNVAIVNDCFGVSSLFKKRKDIFEWDNWRTGMKGYDILILTGGSDINSKLYNEEPKYCGWFNDKRDEFEIQAVKEAGDAIFKAGICRGAQLLNVLNGGTLWQDVNNHSGIHLAKDLRTGKFISLSSAHHQMMRPVGVYELIATADRATSYKAEKEVVTGKQLVDPEVIWFPKTNSLCFQAHPEFGPDECENYFFDLIKEKFNGYYPKAA